MSYFLAISLAAIFGGSIATLVKYALPVFPTFFLLLIRYFVAVLTLLPLIIKSGELKLNTFKNLTPVGIIGALNPALLYISLNFTQASVTPLIYAATPLLTAIYYAYTKKEKITPQMLKGIIVGLIGVWLIIFLPLMSQNDNQHLSFLGNLLIFAATLAFTTYGILSKKKSSEIGASPVALTFYFSLYGLLFCLPFVFREFSAGMIHFNQATLLQWLSAIATGLIGTTLFYLIYQYAIKSGGATAASLFTYLQPIVGILLPLVILGETISLPFIIGAVLAIFGVQLATRKGYK